ncbi:putative WRKY transcription factor 19 [Senna tora]|uniref:Putative WRKY transcription factor 19 n=1 Tax=Senna tora TaxID=362788 RepID=A0A834XDW1_9FABA|nr:putative WRKY transcription factor 19 [Senna tora]
MDLNKRAVLCSYDAELGKNDNFGDTTLSLNGLAFGKTNTTNYRHTESNLGMKFSNASDDGCRLVLGLGPPPRAYGDDNYSLGFNKKKELTTQFSQHLGLSGGTNDASSVMDYSGSIENDVNMPCLSSQTSTENNYPMVPVVDEGSTSAKKSGGYMPSLLLAPRMGSAKFSVPAQELLILGTKPQLCQESSDAINYSLGTISEPQETGTTSENRTSNPKRCKFFGCTKGARGASGLCIGHGGGQRCQKPGCNKGAESRTAYCKAHGGGKRCQHLGCTKSAEGKTDYCIAHGGGRRCGYSGGCSKAARGKSGLCIRHGGGKRCKVEGCTRSAEGQAGLCISHGGGRRCQHQGCTKGAQGSTMFCKAHGGGKRCSFAGCTKGAEGSTPLCKAHGGGKRCLFNGGGICPKSVHGGTNFCVAHGGGKRCSVPGCTKSARGRTDCCVRHGGGKRCKSEGCGKSAQGSTDFCKAHGGGKRCSWGKGKCEKFARGKSGLCAAHSSLMLERQAKKGSLIAPGLFHGLVPSASAACSSFDNNSSSAVSVVSDSHDSMEKPSKKQHLLIPEEVLVPLSMKSSSYLSFLTAKKPEEDRNGHGTAVGCSGAKKGFDFNLPEDRVHGGNLMLYFGGNLKNALDGI